MNKSRLEAFSDGVFAIVITLLILDVRIPSVPYEHLPAALYSILPSIMAYVMSFIIIGLYWVSHHNSFQKIQKTDGTVVWLNILLLLFVSFIPFPTSLLGKYPFKPIPIILYGATLLASNLMGLIMVLYVEHHKDLMVPGQVAATPQRLGVYLYVIVIYVIALIIAPFVPVVSYIIFGLAVIVLAFYTGKAR